MSFGSLRRLTKPGVGGDLLGGLMEARPAVPWWPFDVEEALRGAPEGGAVSRSPLCGAATSPDFGLMVPDGEVGAACSRMALTKVAEGGGLEGRFTFAGSAWLVSPSSIVEVATLLYPPLNMAPVRWQWVGIAAPSFPRN